jgi:hypothetical protein
LSRVRMQGLVAVFLAASSIIVDDYELMSGEAAGMLVSTSSTTRLLAIRSHTVAEHRHFQQSGFLFCYSLLLSL